MPFDVAQYCLNGHIISGAVRHNRGALEKFCSRCGSETITQCETCQTDIRGTHYGRVVYTPDRPAYCNGCGKPFPWTTRSLVSARELARFELSDAENHEFADIIENLVKDTPSTPVAIARMEKLVAKMKPAVSEGLKQILSGVIVESVKKAIWP
jgi:hypothetical protein